jgi:Ni,Fe-hydrogenase III large subunit
MNTSPRLHRGTDPGAHIEHVAANDWCATCLHAHDSGERFGGLFAAPRDTETIEVRALFSSPAGERIVCCQPAGRTLDTLVDEIPAAAWHEREAHDLHGLHFSGHDPTRPLLDHDAPLEAWTVPTVGHDVHQVAVGPIHAGVIESGHFRFHVVGERILHLDVRLFYKRRGLERAAIGQPLADGLAYAQRACAACAVTNSVAYAHAAEAALGLAPDRELRRARTLLLELERVYNHLHDLSAICAGVGFAPGTMAYAALKERVQRINAQLTGHRFLFNTVTLGASQLTVDGPEARSARDELRAVRDDHATCWRQLQFVVGLQERLEGVGVLGHDEAERLGAVGPAARAAGVRHDARSDSPRLWYHDFDPVDPPLLAGDVASRMTVRAWELEHALGLLDELLNRPVRPGRAQRAAEPGALGIARVESPRGETVCVVERDRDRVRALHLRTASYANWPVLAHAVAGNLLPDFPLINKSFELCYACVDR